MLLLSVLRVAECRSVLLSSAEEASEAAMAAVNGRLIEALSNQKKIEHDTRQLQLQSAQLTKYTNSHTHH